MLKRSLLLVVAVVALQGLENIFAAKAVHGLTYTYSVNQLKAGQSLGNRSCYATLDSKTDLLSDSSSVRFGLKESTNQTYYLIGWNVSLTSAEGGAFSPVNTTFTPASQETELNLGETTIRKKFFLPFENNYLRSAHFLIIRDILTPRLNIPTGRLPFCGAAVTCVRSKRAKPSRRA